RPCRLLRFLLGLASLAFVIVGVGSNPEEGMGIKVSPEDTIAAATIMAGYVVAFPKSWEIGYPQMAKICIHLGGEIAKARQDLEQGLNSDSPLSTPWSQSG